MTIELESKISCDTVGCENSAKITVVVTSSEDRMGYTVETPDMPRGWNTLMGYSRSAEHESMPVRNNHKYLHHICSECVFKRNKLSEDRAKAEAKARSEAIAKELELKKAKQEQRRLKKEEENASRVFCCDALRKTSFCSQCGKKLR